MTAQRSISFATLLVVASRLAAQSADACVPRGPGVAFGVTAFNCASCEIHKEKGARPSFLFNAEPVLLRTGPTSQLQSGDVIEAVNGQPITTRAGAEQFISPAKGETVIMVRRGGSRVRVTVTPSTVCDPGLEDADSTGTILGKDMTVEYRQPAGGKLVATSTGSFREDPPPGVSAGGRARGRIDVASPDSRYGLGLACQAPCTKAHAPDGTEYWKFDGYPSIAELRAGGAAVNVGLKVGDVITDVDGISILSEEGALRFSASARKESLHLMVLRDGKKVGYLLRAP